MSNVFKFSNGKTVTIDIKAISWNEWRGLLRGTLENEDAVIAKMCGIEVEKLLQFYELPQPEIRLFLRAVIDSGQRPLDDPNSASESTTE